MQSHFMRRFWLAGLIGILLLSAGCFQPAGGGLEATQSNQAIPTNTPMPTLTSTPIPLPSDTPTALFLEPDTQVPTFSAQEAGTQVALLPNDQIDPIFQTATAVYLLNQGQQPLQVQPLDVATLDPLLASATALVDQATSVPLTLTAQALGIFPTATFPLLFPTPTSGGSVILGADCIYEIQPGDRTLYQISLKFGIPYIQIAQASHLVNPNLIHVGDRLTVPGCGTTGYVVPPTSTPGAGVVYPTAAPGGSGSGGTYVVQTGDTLFGLSMAWGTTVEAIAQLNSIPNVNLIYIGQTLNIP